MAAAANQLGSVEHIVVLVLENRSFDHMLGFLYADSGNVSPATKQPFEGLTGKEANPDASGAALPISALTPGQRTSISPQGRTPAKVSWPPTRNFSEQPARAPAFRRPTPDS
jgi:phospholipase C